MYLILKLKFLDNYLKYEKLLNDIMVSKTVSIRFTASEVLKKNAQNIVDVLKEYDNLKITDCSFFNISEELYGTPCCLTFYLELVDSSKSEKDLWEELDEERDEIYDKIIHIVQGTLVK